MSLRYFVLIFIFTVSFSQSNVAQPKKKNNEHAFGERITV